MNNKIYDEWTAFCRKIEDEWAALGEKMEAVWDAISNDKAETESNDEVKSVPSDRGGG